MSTFPKAYTIEGGTPSYAYRPAWSTTPQSDASSLVVSASTIKAGSLSIDMQNTSTVSFTPGTGARWTVPLQDIYGDTTNLVIGDVLQTFAKAASHYVDIVLWIGFLDSVSGQGAAFGICSNGSNWQACTSRNGGSGWTAPAVSTNGDPSTVGSIGWLDLGTSATAASIFAACINSSNELVSTTGQSVTRAAQTGMTLSIDTMFMEVGWRTGVGGVAGIKQLGGSFLCINRQEADIDPFV